MAAIFYILRCLWKTWLQKSPYATAAKAHRNEEEWCGITLETTKQKWDTQQQFWSKHHGQGVTFRLSHLTSKINGVKPSTWKDIAMIYAASKELTYSSLTLSVLPAEFERSGLGSWYNSKGCLQFYLEFMTCCLICDCYPVSFSLLPSSCISFFLS